MANVEEQGEDAFHGHHDESPGAGKNGNDQYGKAESAWRWS